MAEAATSNDSWRPKCMRGSREGLRNGDIVLAPSTDKASRLLRKSELDQIMTLVDLSDPNGVCKGAGVPVYSDGREVYVDDSFANTLIVARTGAGKTRGFVMPEVELLMKRKESMVINDPKGEITKMFYNGLKEAGYDIRILNIRDPECSDNWNPFAVPYKLWKSGESDVARDLLLSFSKAISPIKSNKEPFWDMAAQYAIYGCSCLMIERANDESEVNLRSLADIIMRTSVNDDVARRLITSLNLETNFIERLSLSTAYNNAETTRRCIFGMAFNAIIPLVSRGDLVRMTSSDDFDMETIGLRPTAYLIVTPDETDAYNILVGRFITQLNYMLIRKAQELPGARLPIRVNMILDELATLTEINNLAGTLSTSRSRNIRYTMVLQSIGQLKMYGEKDSTTIMDNCSNIIYMGGRDMDFVDYLCRLVGRGDNGEFLITPSQLMCLKRGKEALVKCGDNPAFIGKLTDISEYMVPSYKSYVPDKKAHIEPHIIGDRIFLNGSKAEAEKEIDVFDIQHGLDEKTLDELLDAAPSPKRRQMTVDEMDELEFGKKADNRAYYITEDEGFIGPSTTIIDADIIRKEFDEWGSSDDIFGMTPKEVMAIIDFADSLSEPVSLSELFDDVRSACESRKTRGLQKKYGGCISDEISESRKKMIITKLIGSFRKRFGKNEVE